MWYDAYLAVLQLTGNVKIAQGGFGYDLVAVLVECPIDEDIIWLDICYGR
jgi:hypothetical protein